MKRLDELLKKFKHERTSVKADFKAFLKQNNCKNTEHYDKKDKSTRYYFDYQGGHFVADIKDSNRGVDITFPGIADMPVDELPLVRTLCNHYNASNTFIKFTYSTNEEDNRVHVHISFFANTVWPEELPESLTACFYYQRQFCDEYKGLKLAAKENDTDDVERDHQQVVRERYMLLQQELNHQCGNPSDWRPDHHSLRLDTMLEKMLGIRQVRILNIDGDTECIKNDDKTTLDLAACCSPSLTKARSMTLEVNIGDDDAPRYIQMLITSDNKDMDDCVRITATLVPEPRSRRAAINSESQLPMSNSVLVAMNCDDTKQMQSEFDYMWKDAQLKMRDGEPLDELQQLIADVTDANIGYNIYWGRKHMLNGRFYQALQHLENAFNAMRTIYFDLKKEMRETFFETCYYIGFCYTELHLYRDAYYYLEYLRDNGNIRHTSELINALANGKDFRLFALTDDIINAIHQQYEHDEDIPERLQSFINFMRRRRAYALIDHHQLDEAERAFTAMLDDPENSDYALGELAYIKRLRKADLAANESEAQNANKKNE